MLGLCLARIGDLDIREAYLVIRARIARKAGLAK
jgi:hypothetical protein